MLEVSCFSFEAAVSVIIRLCVARGQRLGRRLGRDSGTAGVASEFKKGEAGRWLQLAVKTEVRQPGHEIG